MSGRVCAPFPTGETETYGTLAQQLATSPRALARACAANPLPIVVPCHRVIAARGRLGGYSAGDGLATKVALLALEGAPPCLFREKFERRAEPRAHATWRMT